MKHWFIGYLTEKYTTGKTLGLDAGCGYGNWDEYKKCKFINVDYTPRNNVDLVHDFNNKMPFPDGYFDVVISYNVLEYVENKALFLDEIYRVIKPKGIFVCIVQNKLIAQRVLNGILGCISFKSILYRNIKDWLFATWYNLTSVYAFQVVEKN